MRLASPSARFAVLALASLSGLVCCATTSVTRPILPLPRVRLQEVGDLILKGSYLQALQETAWLHGAADPELPSAELADLEAKALGALKDGFSKAIGDKAWNDALRLEQSVRALGKPELAPGWTDKELLLQIARSREAAGEGVSGLAARMRALAAGDPSPEELREDFAAAAHLGNLAVARSLAEDLRRRGLDSPGPLPEPPSFDSMLQGTVTIWVNRGIKIEKGVGYPDRVIGSGFFIDRRGYLLTNYHVIRSEVDPKYEGFSRLFVRLSGNAAERIPAKVVGWDPVLDLALIKVEIEPSWTFSGNPAAQLSVGERIYAIGSPAGLDRTLTSGIVSATGRRFLQVGEELQVDVPLNPGSSGGPLLREGGEVIGVVFAGLEQFEGINFAIPWYWVERSLSLLYAGGEAAHPWLGAALAETEHGLEVLYTVPGEPAERAGLEPGDTLEEVGGRRVATLRDAQDAVFSQDAPSLLTLGISRAGEARSLLVCLAARPSSPVERALERDALEGIVFPLFGMRLERSGTAFGRATYTVRRIIPGSVADEAGLSENDPLTMQNWTVDKEKRYVQLEIVVQKKKAGFIESAVQIAAWLDTDNFL